ncbi:glycosyltransferase family 4 protein [Algoriphagus namhaensis]
MKVLIVCSYNSGSISPFIQDQVGVLQRLGVEIEYFLIKGKGVLGYLSNIWAYHKKINLFKPDVIHAHFGLAGVFSCLQFSKPLVVTFHGSDINLWTNLLLSRIAIFLSKKSIFVSESLRVASNCKKGVVIPCGVDIELFQPIGRKIARKAVNISENEKIVLFSSSFNRSVKNADLAIKAVSQLAGVRLIELKGYSRREVCLLMNAADVCLSTSFSEGSPQFIKEALCCNAIVVSTNVGDLDEYALGLKGFYFTDFDIESCSKVLSYIFQNRLKIKSKLRDSIRNRFDNRLIGQSILDLYESIL